MSNLFRVDGNQLVRAARTSLSSEDQIEGWVFESPSLVGLSAIIIGRQVVTPHHGRIDILALEKDGSLVIIELKRDRTPRDIVAQTLDYASWVAKITTREVHELCMKYRGQSLESLYNKQFGGSPPETLNASHQMMIVAGEMDEATRRIVEYLSEEHSVGINVSFFNVFKQDGATFLTTDTLLEQEEVTERATRKARAPWSGFWYLTAGSEDAVSWQDLRTHGYVVASGGKWYADGLARLTEGDKVFFYQKNTGYLGYGVVSQSRQPASDFILDNGQRLIDEIPRPYFTEFGLDPEKQAFVVGINWLRTFDRSDAKSFTGIFANQNIACKISDEDTISFLPREFGVELTGELSDGS